MGRKSGVRSRKNTNTATKVESVKSLLVASGIGEPDGYGNGGSQRTISRSPSIHSVAEQNGTEAQADGDDTYLISHHVQRFVIKQLIFSRIILLSAQCLFNALVPDWPTDAFQGVLNPSFEKKSSTVELLIGGLARWDARQFLHIAEFGYTWESSLAFFPLFPIILRWSGAAMSVLTFNSLPLVSAMVLGGVLLNNILFVLNGVLLFRLCIVLTKSTKESIIAVYIYCFNPASIFFSALYTESLFFFFVLCGLLTVNDENSLLGTYRLPVASCIFAFSYLVRSNGLLNIGYIGFPIMVAALIKWDVDGRPSLEGNILKILWKSLKQLPIFLLCFAVIIAPLRLVSMDLEEKFCNSTPQQIENLDSRLHSLLAENSSRVLPGHVDQMKWCSLVGSRWNLLGPAYYANVQAKYWDVGLFSYWQFKKLPLFALAAPSLLFVLYGILDILFDIGIDQRSGAEILVDKQYLLPSAIHSALIATAALFVYNVEVATRMLFSASPFLYIVIARIMSAQTPLINVPDDLMEPPLLPFFANYAFVRPLHFLMMAYLMGYFFIGTLLHVNWLAFC